MEKEIPESVKQQIKEMQSYCQTFKKFFIGVRT
jgi:hypothetical protein